MIQYRIEWTYIPTGTNGHGDWFNQEDKDFLISCIKYSNDIHKNKIIHKLFKK